MPFRVILFDLDGTLIDSLADIAAAANIALRELGQPTHPVPDYRQMVGDGADVLLQRALPDDQQHLAAEALALFKHHYAEHLVRHTTLYEGMAETLDALVDQGLRIAIVTNKPQSAADRIAHALLRRWPWVVTTGHRADHPKKPDPAPALAAAEAAQAAPSQCLFVGDSKTDMLTATAAGMTGVGVTWGFRTRAELIAHDATHLVDHPHQLLDLLHGPPAATTTDRPPSEREA